MAFLDETGLRRLWEKIKTALATKAGVNDANTFTQENKFTNGSYAPTFSDIASGIGKSSCFTRGAFMQAIMGQIIAPNKDYAEAAKAYDITSGEIKFYKVTATSNGQPTLQLLGKINSNGWVGNVVGNVVGNADTADLAEALKSSAGSYNTPIYFKDGKPAACAKAKAGDYFDGVVVVGADGVMEVGRYIDFHEADASAQDYTVRLDAGSGTTKRVFTFPSAGGELLTKANADNTYAKKSEVGGGGSYTKVTATFDGLGWSSESDGSYTQTLTVSGVTATNDILVAPNNSYIDTYEAMGCYAISQAANSVTFKCYDPQDVALKVDIIIFS